MIDGGNKANHLIHEMSPYLLQHAYNPVDWYPWGDEAFNKARKEDKPIIVSIGYSTCHWCHVMEAESFSNNEIADIMNTYFVCIKVDREERPDIDKIHITAVSAMAGSAGWPLNVFLTPDELKPFYGGTYFPPETRGNMPSWPDILRHIGNAWKDPAQKNKILNSAETFKGVLQSYLSPGISTPAKEDSFDFTMLDAAYKKLSQSYDSEFGGFSGAPKFPSPSNLNFLMFYRFYSESRNAKESAHAFDMVLHTLTAMARGGIYDQVGGGFHRYSTDGKWHVPHFEKMLYDNAGLALIYTEAFTVSGDRLYADIAENIISYILRDMTHPEGAFYSAEDADSIPQGSEHTHRKVEGAYYVWDMKEFREVLETHAAEIMSYIYGMKPGGNVASDPFGEFKGKNVPYVAHTLKEAAKRFNTGIDNIKETVARAKKMLFGARGKRHRPHLDDKIITSWNGLMISALARAYQAFDDERYTHAAEKTADFIYRNLYDKDTRQLFRIWRDGKRNIPGLADDYAFLTQGLIDLYEACFDPRWLIWAIDLSNEQTDKFCDENSGGFFMTRKDHDANLLFRLREDTDDVIPSANSIAAMNFKRLARLTHNERFAAIARKTIQSTLAAVKDYPAAAPQMLIAMGAETTPDVQIVVAGAKNSAETKKLLKAASSYPFYTRSILLAAADENLKNMTGILPLTGSVHTINGEPAAYICYNKTCREPVTRADDLSNELKRAFTIQNDRKNHLKKATFAAGCFWKPEVIFATMKGVESTAVGYTGGFFENPTYEDVCAGKTGHAEAVEITYDPSIVSYDDLLDMFWKIHDPTTLNYQGADVGAQYRSAIFYHDDDQKKAAEESKEKLAASGRYKDPVVTEIQPVKPFYRAEEYHQQYLKKQHKPIFKFM